MIPAQFAIPGFLCYNPPICQINTIMMPERFRTRNDTLDRGGQAACERHVR